MEIRHSDDTPRGFLEELRSAFWNRRAGQIALAILLAESALRLINGFVAYVLVPFITGFANSNSESVLFPSKPIYRLDAFVYLLLEFGIVVIVFFYAGRALRPKRLRLNEAEVASHELEDGSHEADSPEPQLHTITGEPVNEIGFEATKGSSS